MTTDLSWLYLPTAFILGMAHALEPGHGKTIMASYLVSIKGKPLDALLLGLTVTFTHTVVIFILALMTLLASELFPVQKVQYYLGITSAALVFLMGGWLLQSKIHEWQHASGHVHGHDHHHHHHHHHGHSHELPSGQRLSLKQLVAFGLAGGLIPCPPALAIFILSVGTGKPILGIVTVIIFSAGLAVTLVGIGITVCKGIDVFKSKLNLDKYLHILPILSAALVTLLGLGMLIHAASGHHQ